ALQTVTIDHDYFILLCHKSVAFPCDKRGNAEFSIYCPGDLHSICLFHRVDALKAALLAGQCMHFTCIPLDQGDVMTCEQCICDTDTEIRCTVSYRIKDNRHI